MGLCFLLLFSSAVIVSPDLPTLVSYCSWPVWRMFRSPVWWCGPLTVFCCCSVAIVSPDLLTLVSYCLPWVTYLGFLLFLTSLTNVSISCLVIWASNSFLMFFSSAVISPDLPTLVSYYSWRVWQMFLSPARWCGPLTVSCYCSVERWLSPWFTYLGFLLFLNSLTNISISCLVMCASNSFLLLFSRAVIVSPDLPTLVSYCSWPVWRMFRSPAWWYGPPTVFCCCSVAWWLSPHELPTLVSYCSWRVWQMFRSPAWWYGPLAVSCYCSVARWLSPLSYLP